MFDVKTLFSVSVILSVCRSRTSTLPSVNLQMPKVPNLTVPSVNLPQIPSFSPPNWRTTNDSECVSAYTSRDMHSSLAWMWHLKSYEPSSRITCFLLFKKMTVLLLDSGGNCHCMSEKISWIMQFGIEHFYILSQENVCKSTGQISFDLPCGIFIIHFIMIYTHDSIQ